MSTRRIIWLLLLIFNLVVFFFLIPADVYDESDMFFSFLGGFLFFICLFQVVGNFDSFYELFEKADPDEPQPPGRKLAPLAVLPAFILVIILIFYHSGIKNDELAAHGILTKGTVVGGESTTTRRNFQSNTSYSIRVAYEDSLHRRYTIEASVNGADFRNLYEGAPVDVVYSKLHPGLAKPLLTLEELSKIKPIPQEKIKLAHLLAIMDGKVNGDSALSFLNSINYEWTPGDEKGYYKNDKLNMAIKHFPEEGRMAYIHKINLWEVNTSGTFEDTIGEQGFKKKASNVNGEEEELYYSDTYVISKERKQADKPANEGFTMEGYEIYHIAKIASLDK